MRAGFCAIVGRPNVGKSTFLNRVLGQKVAAVTPKPQTTRDRIRGIVNLPAAEAREAAQIVFVDTPGVHRGKSELNQYMVEQALAAASEADVVLLMIEAPHVEGKVNVGPGQEMIVEALRPLKQPKILVINKVDRIKEKTELLPVIATWKELLGFDEIIPIAAAQGKGIDAVLHAVARRLPEHPALYPEDVVTDKQERFLAAEAVREQVFLRLKQEVPYGTAVTVEKFEERRAKTPAREREVAIEATIHLERDSQKSIVIGKGGQVLKEIGMRARAELATMIGCAVHLKLWVKVDPDWTANRSALKRLGYD